jgi:hypothetical protein
MEVMMDSDNKPDSDEVDSTNARDSRPINPETTSTPTEAGNTLSPPSIKRKHTGPRTTAGKERSRRNALKLGIFAKVALLPDESPAEFNALRRVLRDAYQPLDGFMEMIVEKMTVNVWMQRRAIGGEVAGIEEVRRGYAFRSDDHEPASKTVGVLVHFEGQEDHRALMEHALNPGLPAIERCIQLLEDLATGIRSAGFDSNRDRKILGKLYGRLDNDNPKLILLKSYNTWQVAASRSQEERLRTGTASPQECVDCFIKDAQAEIKRLENQKLVDLDRMKLRRRRQAVPDYRQSDHFLHRLTTLERSFDRMVAQLERHRRMLLGQPVPPQIEVHHSVSHD